MKSNVLKPNSSTSWFSHSLSSLAVCGAHTGTTTASQEENLRDPPLRFFKTSKEKINPAYLEDVQDLVRFLLGDDGVVVETTELPLEPEGVDVAGVQVLLLGRHHVTGDTELKSGI